MEDLDAIIEREIAKAEGSSDIPDDIDTGGDDDSGESDESADDPAAGDASTDGVGDEGDAEGDPDADADGTADSDAGADADAQADKDADKKKDDPKESPEDERVTKLLEEHGIRKAAKGQRDNPIPYSRVRRITRNFIKSVEDAHQQELATRDSKITRYEKELQAVSATNRLIETDADRYLTMLAAIHPDKYGKFLKGGQVASSSIAATPDAKDDPKPAPDVKFEDGSTGYSPENHDKLLAWATRQGVRQAMAEMDKRFGPIEKKFRTEQDRNERMPVILAEIERVRAIYGDPKDPNNPFTQDEKLAASGQSKILAYQREHAQYDAMGRVVSMPTIAEAAAAVLVPLMRSQHAESINTARKKWIEEQKKKPGRSMATTTPSKPVKKAPAPGTRDLDEVIDEELRKHGL